MKHPFRFLFYAATRIARSALGLRAAGGNRGQAAALP